MKVEEVMHHVTMISSNTSISKAAAIMGEKSIGSALVGEYGNAIGIITERDILLKVVAKGKSPDELKIEDIMSKPVLTIDANEDIVEASRKMDQNKIRRLIVVDNGEIVGKVTANSISRNLKYMMVREPQVYTRAEY